MKPLSTTLLVLAALGAASGADAGGYNCKPISGTVLIAPDAACRIVQAPAIESRLPSVLFLGSAGIQGTCFAGVFSGTWGGVPITGTALSGLTWIANPPPAFGASFATAATVLTVARDRSSSKLPPIPLGSLYLLDSIHFTDQAGGAEEQLVISDGIGAFRNAKGSLGIVGNEFVPPGAPVQGTLCLPD